jgi:hypothetical protein
VGCFAGFATTAPNYTQERSLSAIKAWAARCRFFIFIFNDFSKYMIYFPIWPRKNFKTIRLKRWKPAVGKSNPSWVLYHLYRRFNGDKS